MNQNMPVILPQVTHRRINTLRNLNILVQACWTSSTTIAYLNTVKTQITPENHTKENLSNSSDWCDLWEFKISLEKSLWWCFDIV